MHSTCRKYNEQYAYYRRQRKNNAKAVKTKKQQAEALLTSAVRTGDLASQTHFKLLRDKQNNGTLDRMIPHDQLQAQAANVGAHANAQYLLSQNLSTGQYEELDSAIRTVEHQGGPTMTESLGDMRGYGGSNTPATQRFRNTGMTRMEQPNNVTLSGHNQLPRPTHPSLLPTPQNLGRRLPPSLTSATTAAATSSPVSGRQRVAFQQQSNTEETPDYIQEPRELLENRIAFGDGSDNEEAYLLGIQVQQNLEDHEKGTVRMAKNWKERENKTNEEIVEGLIKVQKAKNSLAKSKEKGG